MALLGDVITVAQLIAAEIPELVDLYNAIAAELKNRDTTSATQAAIAATDVAVDVNEDLKFPRGTGE
jgi:hypothetical protein